MKRLTLAAFALAVLILMNISCGSAPSGSSQSAAETAKQMAQTAPAVTVTPQDPKALITDDKIGRFIIYQREANTVANIALGAATQALKNSDGSQRGFEKELSSDERSKKIAEVQASALSKSGLGQMEAVEITKIVTEFTARATMGTEEMKKEARNQFTAKYGADKLAIMEKYLPELSKLQDEMLEAALGKKK